MRQIITSVLGIVLLIAALYFGRIIVANKKIPEPVERKLTTTVFVDTIKNSTIPIQITANGILTASRKVALFAEVQGVFEKSSAPFKAGVRFNKGSILLQINSAEIQSSLQAQKSTLQNQIVQLLPDLRIDFPEAFPKWEQYIHNFDINSPIQVLPEPNDQKEKLFIAAKNISSSYYTIKNLEDRLAKYTIRAPWNGILTDAFVTSGTLIRPNQALGEFIDPSSYELEVAVNSSYGTFLKKGAFVELSSTNSPQAWTGKIIRINSKVDASSQSIPVFIQLSGEGLREGMYLKAVLEAKAETEAVELSRKLLLEDNQIFVVQDSVLDLAEVNPVYFKEKTVVIKGLDDGTAILARPVPGAYAGMSVSILEEE